MSQTSHQDSITAENTVTRVVHIGATEFSEDVLRQVEGQFPGILRLVFNKQTGSLTIAYDTAKLAFGQILSRLAEMGVKPLDTWAFRLKAAWYDFTDQNTSTQAHAKPKGCCNKIPGA
ncbi:hypothetical protein GALL_332610 [mine drainage metagenome]|uniref:HMA domain-containing protein n=1 Tax=mine drainage metagenome TaxID=410659 RepID=A0A1J5R9R5_9ZZZZ